ncbi:thymidine phosphorylase [Rhodanobacter sp. AS-Z3]|uniref:thymidine phosphorylase n=1 Tax=Rhodanobacter sp. AS-Z3 TaxID=3031330 RepID=UPI002478B271|nr:thymidine phosphorylase [Rhodanobacter sp. AS-Z3]WEN14534.1 thymidine phosphorylase [Rhodanobacter sp. AS-Z3]
MNGLSAASLIRRKRNGERLEPAELRAVAQGIGNDTWSEGQVGAFAMAVAWRGMGVEECRDFTLALRDSGQQLRWDDLPGPVLDKHSTGGVGDGVSLLLAPLLAACGGYVPMISGRGLGHTGGTLDKLESVAGYNVHPTTAHLREVVHAAGCAIVGQGADWVPADRRLYAVRDVTATVDVAELMVASILSKKLAGGAQALVLDIKTGNGAQLPGMAAARALAERMLATARGTGLDMRAVFSDMDQVLGREAGNALELRAALDLLCGRGNNPRLLALTLELATELLGMGGLCHDRADADSRLRAALSSGAAAERFAHMVSLLGGPADLLERPEAYLEAAPVQQAVLSPMSGHIAAVDVRALGQVVVDLGGGRTHPGQAIDHAVGLAEVIGRGDAVEQGQPLAIVHARNAGAAGRVEARVRQAFRLALKAPPLEPLWHWHVPTECVG